MLEQLPAASATRIAINPADAWTLQEHLLAGIYDRLAAANWQRSGKGQKPRPIPRPGTPHERRFGSGSHSIEEMRQILDEWHQINDT